MTIVELPKKDKQWMDWYTDGHYMGTYWVSNNNVEVDISGSGRWQVTLRNDRDGIMGFIYADAIRRK